MAKARELSDRIKQEIYNKVEDFINTEIIELCGSGFKEVHEDHIDGVEALSIIAQSIIIRVVESSKTYK